MRPSAPTDSASPTSGARGKYEMSKAVSITNRVRFKFPMEMLNAFKHPTFGQSTTGLASTGFGRAGQQATSRRIEFRGNLEF